MPRRHQQRAERNDAHTAEHPVAERAAEHRREIDEPDVEAENLEGERLRGQRPGDGLGSGAEGGEARHMLDIARQQQLLHHVEHEQRLHAVKRNPVPQLRPSDKQQAAGVPESGFLRTLFSCKGRHFFRSKENGSLR